jgi:hypothetical protein
MTGTTDRLDLLWHIQWVPTGQHLATLKVTDNMPPHYPKAVGYVRVPTDSAIGYRMCRCYYTPTLSATILLSDAMGKQFAWVPWLHESLEFCRQ